MRARKAWVEKRGQAWYVRWQCPVTNKERRRSLGKKKSDATEFAAEKTAAILKGESDGCKQF